MVVTNEIENYIVLSEEQRKNVCEELAKLVFESQKDESIVCVYFAPFKNLGDISGNVLDVTIVKDGYILCEDGRKLDDYNDLHQKKRTLKQYGVKINLDFDISENYTSFPQSSIERNSGYNLLQSTILFDRTGKYKKIKEMIKNRTDKISFYSNLAQIEPPIMDEFGEALVDCKMQKDTDVVRKFTKTETFKYIADMK